jgi:hypothetical protein
VIERAIFLHDDKDVLDRIGGVGGSRWSAWIGERARGSRAVTASWLRSASQRGARQAQRDDNYRQNLSRDPAPSVLPHSFHD